VFIIREYGGSQALPSGAANTGKYENAQFVKDMGEQQLCQSIS
jgi:hypothetical protein